MRQRIAAMWLMAAAAAVLAGCMPKMPEVSTEPVRRNVSVEVVQPQLIEVQVKLPAMLKPREEIELRARQAGVIVDLPFEESQPVPASALPASTWIESEEFLSANPSMSATDDACLYRNLSHLQGLKPFALIEDHAARASFRDSQAQYDAACRALNRVLGYKDSTEAAIDAARTQKVSARVACDRLRHMIEDCYVCNPRQGVLMKRNHRPGEFVNGGELLGIVAVMDPLVAELHVPEAHRHAISVGQEINIVVQSVKDASGNPLSLKARVRLVDQVAHAATHSFRVEADVANADLRLPANIFGTCHLVVYRKEAGLKLPLTALKLNKERASIFIVTADKKAKEIANVALGHILGDSAELLDDRLKPGQKLVVTGAQMLADGDLVHEVADPTENLAQPAAKDGRS